MAEALKRWNGSEWVTVAAVTRFGGEPAGGDCRVRFFDYDGTILKTAYCNIGGSVTPPGSPDHTEEGLVFQGWNFTPEELSNVTTDLDVGAIYTTADGKSHLHIRLTPVSGKAPTIYMRKYDSSVLTIDWGDGTSDTFTYTSNFSRSHTYPDYGDYTIKIWISSGAGNYTFGNGSRTTTVVGGSSGAYRSTLIKAFVGDSVTNINNYAFYSCFSLREISLPAGLQTLGNNSLYNCAYLPHITLPHGTSEIGNEAFSSCYSLMSVSIPNTVASIGTEAFHGNSLLQSIVLPRNIEAIGSDTFNGCYGLKSMVIHEGVQTIDQDAFYHCEGLRSIALPSSLKSIGDSAFRYCTSLASMTIPENVESIAEYAFAAIDTIQEYILKPETPPALANANALENIKSIQKIRVPASSLAAYQSAPSWSTYANYMEGY